MFLINQSIRRNKIISVWWLRYFIKLFMSQFIKIRIGAFYFILIDFGSSYEFFQ